MSRTEAFISSWQLREVALSRAEYELILKRLDREPNRLELGMLGVLWSEHCSYKTSKSLLRRLPSRGLRVLQGPGENAGAVDVGDGWACVFKVESHNHPSAIEPYQGAATGVGGILRDVIAMGARPLALLDSLRFGTLPESRPHFEGVVAGIGGYGNCMGIPTVGGEIYFDECYAGNPLVNAMCVGVVRSKELMLARAEGTGSRLLLAGARTGRDGIHGASFASLELDTDADERRPAVQVGNPFLEKCLLEACQELRGMGEVVAVQDLGAAGLTSSVAECAGRAKAGARIDVTRVPRRETGMSPYEVMLSESQERMLIVVRPGGEARVAKVFAKWDLEAAVIGDVTDDGQLTVTEDDSVVVRLPVQLLTEGAPERKPRSQARAEQATILNLDRLLSESEDVGGVLVRLLGSPNLCSRLPVYRRYDTMNGAATIIPPGGDAAMVRINGTRIGLALTLDGNGRYCQLDPFTGAQIAVCEAARNIVATGAIPIGVTDCLNFANPDRPEIYWELEQAVAGIAEACKGLELPVVSGNVSLYNESEQSGAIQPTPVIGMVGVISDYRRRLTAGLQKAGDFVLLIGQTRSDVGGSEYLKVMFGQVSGPPPALDLAREKAVQGFIREAHETELLHSAHDVAEGGMLVALAESCLLGDLGVRCPALVGEGGLRLDLACFSESQSRFLISAPPRAMPNLQTLARSHRVEITLLGLAGGSELEFEGQIRLSLSELRQAWADGLEKALRSTRE